MYVEKKNTNFRRAPDSSGFAQGASMSSTSPA